MKKYFAPLRVMIAFITVSFMFFSFRYDVTTSRETTGPVISFPYKKAGLTAQEAAAHLLNRFTFGPQPGEVDRVVKMGLENWFRQQLQADLPDDSVTVKLSSYESLSLTNAEIVQQYQRPAKVLKDAISAGIISRDSANDINKKENRLAIQQYMKEHGMKPEAELFRQLINQKIIRAAYSQNQLKEVLTDFWFNHFNVSLSKGEDRQFITSYERDVIRPNVLGNFETLLKATAQSPAMLTYLDNFKSAVPKEQQNARQQLQRQKFTKLLQDRQAQDTAMQKIDLAGKVKKAGQEQGINENYAREIMELHTLGVDGGYKQSDVTQAARILSGWTIYPFEEGYGKALAAMLEKMGPEKMTKAGFVHEGDFLFAANRHDAGEKIVLGKTFPANGGYEEGVTFLHMLATHPSTANFISKKLAVRFVSDNPPPQLVNEMAKTFLATDGNIKEVLMTMVSSPAFWSRDAIRQKTKSPFELVISSVRGLNASVDAPYALYNWMTKMGQQIYYYQAPTGFPDRAQYWINTGALLSRMNFGLAIAAQKINGVRFNAKNLNNGHEPESAVAALKTYLKILLPERNLDATVKRLSPLLTQPGLQQQIDQAEIKTAAASSHQNDMKADSLYANQDMAMNIKDVKNKGTAMQEKDEQSMLEQVIGIIIGSPEFQRR